MPQLARTARPSARLCPPLATCAQRTRRPHAQLEC